MVRQDQHHTENMRASLSLPSMHVFCMTRVLSMQGNTDSIPFPLLCRCPPCSCPIVYHDVKAVQADGTFTSHKAPLLRPSSSWIIITQGSLFIRALGSFRLGEQRGSFRLVQMNWFKSLCGLGVKQPSIAIASHHLSSAWSLGIYFVKICEREGRPFPDFLVRVRYTHEETMGEAARGHLGV